MNDDTLSQYISHSRSQGASDGTIRQALTTAGWPTDLIETALAQDSTAPRIDPSIPQTSTFTPQNPNSQNPTQLPGAIDLVKEVLATYKKHFKQLFGIALLPSILTTGGIGFGSMVMQHYNPLAGLQTGDQSMVMLLFGAILIIVVGIAGFFLHNWALLAILHALRTRNTHVSMQEIFRNARAQTLAYIWATFLYGAVVAGGFMVFIVPGFLFLLWFVLYPNVMVAENYRGLHALLRSKQYVSGFGTAILWRSFVYLIIFFVIQTVIQLAVGIPASFINGIVGLPLATIAANIATQALFLPVVLIFSFLLYEKLRVIKGDMPFAPTGKERLSLILFAILGPLIFVGSIILAAIISTGSLS